MKLLPVALVALSVLVGCSDPIGGGDMVVEEDANGKLKSQDVPSTLLAHEQLSRFVRRIFQDQRGHLWFGTNGDGVIRYDGESLASFSINEGFGGVAVRGIVQDKQGYIWFGTERGITRYDGKSFVNFTEKDGLINDDVWSVAIDSKGTI
jgi:ligand-binding sensor domain-containing protein